MLQIAVIEDCARELEQLQGYLNQYSSQQEEVFKITAYGAADEFLETYRAQYDIVFMDIELPGLNGMEAARRLREIDKQVVLIFVTNMAQFAVKGYEVDALDYIVKPVRYTPLSIKLDRAVARCHAAQESVVVRQAGGAARLTLQSILYVESQRHRLTWHTEQGEFLASGTLREVEEQLHGKGFLRSDKGLIVNQHHIKIVDGNDLILTNGERLPISRLRKRQFLEELGAYMRSETLL